MGFIDRLSFHYPDAYIKTDYVLSESTLNELSVVKFKDGSMFPQSYFNGSEVTIGSSYRFTTELEDKVLHLVRLTFTITPLTPQKMVQEMCDRFTSEAKQLIRDHKLNSILNENKF